MGFLKGKSTLMIFDRHANLKYKYGSRNFWCRGYYVDTVTYFYGQSGLIKILGWCGFIDDFLRSSLFCTQIISLCKNIFRTYSLIEKLCRDCIDIRLLNLHLLRDIKKLSEKSFSNEVRDYCKQNTRLRLAVARDRANLLFCSAHADWLPWLVFTIYFMKMKYQEK